MVSQTPAGELTLGDSHEYGSVIDPFNKVEIDAMILDYLDSYFDLRGTKVVSHWSGIYAKHPTEAWTVLHPEPTAHIITGVGGAGMTLSFGVTDRVVREVLGG
jgi:glycine/D-amino acid oxidase-like deaminating enzyme